MSTSSYLPHSPAGAGLNSCPTSSSVACFNCANPPSPAQFGTISTIASQVRLPARYRARSCHLQNMLAALNGAKEQQRPPLCCQPDARQSIQQHHHPTVSPAFPHTLQAGQLLGERPVYGYYSSLCASAPNQLMCISNCAPVKFSIASIDSTDGSDGTGSTQWSFLNGTGTPPGCTSFLYTYCDDVEGPSCCFGDQCNGWYPTIKTGV